VPKTVREALELNKKNDNTLWADAIAKEMKDIRVAFKILPDVLSAPLGYQKIPCHMIFDVKMEVFCCKARLVAGGHKTKAPATITYASVVSRETVRITLLMAALNDLEVKVGDVLNDYITALITEKVWTVLGPKFGIDAGKTQDRRYCSCPVRTEECWGRLSSAPCIFHAKNGIHVLQGRSRPMV
jgi:hypothetical protein